MMMNLMPIGLQAKNFGELRRIVMEKGLMKRQPTYFIRKAIELPVLGIAGFVILFTTTSIWFQLIAALFLACVWMQFSFILHDAGHRQIFASTWKDNVVGYACSLVLGISLKEWIDHHNEHHANPNHLDSDPDLAFPFFAFSEDIAAGKKTRFVRWLVRNQAWLYFCLAFFTSFSIRVGHIRAFLTHPLRKTKIDILCFVAHFVLYFSLIFYFLPFWYAVLFFFVHELLWGFYMGMVFAPNHKGMPIVKPGEKIEFVREQATTSRNVRVPALAGFVFGGLNYQIEHHVFPHMPRNNLRKVQPIIREYCKQQNIPYHEAGVIKSYWEIFSYMKYIGSYARKGVAASVAQSEKTPVIATSTLVPQKQEI